MGEYQIWTNGVLSLSLEENGQYVSSAPPNPNPASISRDSWRIAETFTNEIVCKIHPTAVSEYRRGLVMDYIFRLLNGYLGCQVFPFGSVPLKTYLPDGDIDLTALCIPHSEDKLATDVRSVLEAEEKNKAAEFVVKDIQYIHAEVKLIKCIVQDIVVDISFNQLGGLCTLGFLEKVNGLINKNHLFKRSILLIKAWCYYESRILGAHHGLISTYALETLVLYIFNLFKSSLNGPLAVLYRFLDYYSKFDWENYCVSLNGPVSISCLPEIVAITPDNGGDEFFLDKDFLQDSVETFSEPLEKIDNTLRSFPQKHFNIVDPLRENNNLGRSVSKGNFYRIRSAFTYGARKLGQILSSPEETIADELKKFFMNTLDRHENGQRPDVQALFPPFVGHMSDSSFSMFDGRKCTEGMGDSRLDPQGYLQVRTGDSSVSRSNWMFGTGTQDEAQRYIESGTSSMLLETYHFGNENHVAGYRMMDDAKDHAIFRTQGSRSMNGTSEILSPWDESGASPFARTSEVPSRSLPATDGDTDYFLHEESEETELATNKTFKPYGNHEILASVGTVDGLSISSPRDGSSVSTAGSVGTLTSLADLSGDYDSHIRSLYYASWYLTIVLSEKFPPFPLSPSSIRNGNAYETLRRMIQLKQRMFPHVNLNGCPPRQPFYPANHHMAPNGIFGVEEVQRTRGTGTYFPNMNHHPYKDRPLLGRGRNVQPVGNGQLHRPARGDDWAFTALETNSVERGNQDCFQDRSMVFPGPRRPVPPDSFQGSYPVSRGFSHHDILVPSEKPEFGTFGQLPPTSPFAEASRQRTLGTHAQGLTVNPPSSATERPRPHLGINAEGGQLQAYHLKNEADFPPLSA